MMLIWWGMSLLGASLAAGFGCYMWGSHNAEQELDTEYEEGYNDGMRAARAEMDHADQIILRTQELDVPRPELPDLSGREGRIGNHGEPEPGHTIYAELTPEALDVLLPVCDEADIMPPESWTPPEPDAGFQDVTPADFLSLLSDDEFWPASKLYFAAARCLADAPWQPLPAWTPRMLERAA